MNYSEERELINNQKEDFEFKYDEVTRGMIVRQYIYLGEQIIASLTDTDLNNQLAKLKAQEKEAERNNRVMLIDPEYQILILKGCRELYSYHETAKLDIIANALN